LLFNFYSIILIFFPLNNLVIRKSINLLTRCEYSSRSFSFGSFLVFSFSFVAFPPDLRCHASAGLKALEAVTLSCHLLRLAKESEEKVVRRLAFQRSIVCTKPAYL